MPTEVEPASEEWVLQLIHFAEVEEDDYSWGSEPVVTSQVDEERFRREEDAQRRAVRVMTDIQNGREHLAFVLLWSFKRPDAGSGWIRKLERQYL